jgi:hypothetical protein
MKLMKGILAIGMMMSSAAWAAEGDVNTYNVRVTNLTKGVSFTPLLAATHTTSIRFFTLGFPASDALADLAEGGATGGLEMLLQDQPDKVLQTATTGGLLGPGESVSFMIDGDDLNNRFSMAGMLLPTNDAFVAIQSMRLPQNGATWFAMAYDAGSEENDELCMNIPGPTCGGTPFSEGHAEGFVHPSSGIHGEGDLSASAHGWNNPVARVTITRMD